MREGINKLCRWPMVIVVLINLISCSSQPTATPQPIVLPASPAPTEVAVQPTPTLIPDPTPTETTPPATSPPLTSTSTLTLPVLAGTPVPLPQEPLTPDNVDQIRELAIWGKGRIEQLAYSPNGKILAVGTTAGVWLYDAETLAELHFINMANFVGSLAFSEDGMKLIVDSGASTVSIWDVITASRLSSQRIRDGYQGNINSSPGSIVFSPGATVLAATLDDLRIGLWTNHGEKYLYTLEGHKDTVNKLALSPDHKLLVHRGVNSPRV